MDKPNLVLFMGPSGVGKTTLAKKFAKENDYVYLAPDDFYKQINGDDKIRNNRFTVWVAFFSAINANMEVKKNVVLDSNALRLNDRDQFLDWFPDFNHYLCFVEASYEQRSANNQKRDRKVPEEAMRRMDDVLEPPRWFGLDRRWIGFVHIKNENNKFKIVEEKYSHE